MKLKTLPRLFAILPAAMLCFPAHGLLFEARFNASSTGAGIQTNRDALTDLAILERCVGAEVGKKALRRDYRLVYNTTTDRLQVVHSDSGELVCDVLIFTGGNATWSSRQSERVAIVYLPGSEAPIGSALISERAPSNNSQGRAAITARLQMVLPSDSALAGGKPRARDGDGDADNFYSLQNVPLPDGDARIYSGLLTTGRLLEFDDDGSPTAPGAPDDEPSAQDVAFLRDAAQLSLAEVQVGELIVQKAQSAALRAYGQQLVNDHTAALQQVIALATQEQISVPTTVASADRERLRRLGSANGPAFENLARQIAVQAHEEAITRFETALERVQDADLRAYARAQLPVLRAHLQTARNLPVAGAPGDDAPDPSRELPSMRSPFSRSVGAWF